MCGFLFRDPLARSRNRRKSFSPQSLLELTISQRKLVKGKLDLRRAENLTSEPWLCVCGSVQSACLTCWGPTPSKGVGQVHRSQVAPFKTFFLLWVGGERSQNLESRKSHLLKEGLRLRTPQEKQATGQLQGWQKSVVPTGVYKQTRSGRPSRNRSVSCRLWTATLRLSRFPSFLPFLKTFFIFILRVFHIMRLDAIHLPVPSTFLNK